MLLDQLGTARNILMIQGPLGPFFRSVSSRLQQAGYHVTKINLNAGDDWYYPNGIDFKGSLEDWSTWLEQVIRTHDVEAIMVFGDARLYHRLAHEVALRLGVLFLVFEEGYLRPNWITLEPWGVNAHSTLSRNPEDYSAEPPQPPPQNDMTDHFAYRALLSATYYFITWLFQRRYPYYKHHRVIEWAELRRWMLGGVRKLWYKWTQRHVLETLRREWVGHCFLMPLQVHNDSQLWLHGGHTMEVYIEQTLLSFARYAPANNALIIKHHPMDRAYRDYSQLIQTQVQQLNLIGRVFYVHDIHLPSLFPLLRGTVTVNSSVGMTSIEQGVPVKTLGKAVYDIAGLTHQGNLKSFWNAPQPVDIALSKRYRGWLIAKCQLQGAVYLPECLTDPRAFLVSATTTKINEKSTQQTQVALGERTG